MLDDIPPPKRKKEIFTGVALVKHTISVEIHSSTFGLISHLLSSFPVLVINHSYLLLSIRKLEAWLGVHCVDNIGHFFCCINQLSASEVFILAIIHKVGNSYSPHFKTGGGEAEVWEASVGQGLNSVLLNLG